VLLASAFVSYTGPFNKKFRVQMMEKDFLKWMKERNMPMSSVANPVKILTDDSVIAEWNQ